jgi:hypothetical protein
VKEVTTMPFVLVRHKIEDYERWKRVFDENIPPRQEFGFKEGQILRNTDNPHELFVLFEIEDEQKVRAFFELRRFGEEVRKAGVTDQPDVYFLETLVEATV